MVVPEKVSDLVNNSGNNFHAKVARWLSDNGWHVVVSPYYMDQTQNKAREIDLIAEKLWPVDNRFDPQTIGYVAVRLFIECKFIPSYSVFWFADKDQQSAYNLVNSGALFRADNINTKKHHYLEKSPKVAKLFATSADKAQENEPFYKALNQALNAMVSMHDQPVMAPDLYKKSMTSPFGILQFPVVVCSSFDKIYSVDFYAESEPESIKDNFQLEVRYAYINRQNKQKDEYFLLDFVEYNQLNNFIEAIDQDAKTAAFFASPY